MIVRHLDQALASHFVKYNEVLVLLGARQVGKTTILKRIFPDAHYLVADNDPIKNALERYDPAVYKQLLNTDSGVVVLDEIQKLSDPGRAAKIFFDQLPKFKLIIKITFSVTDVVSQISWRLFKIVRHVGVVFII